VQKTKGFTLIELMIAVAIMGVLVAIAYPSYSNYLIKGNRAAAKAYLLDIAQKQQGFLLDNRAYADSVADLNVPEPAEFSRFYTIAVAADNGPPPSFTATATPKAGTRQKDDGALVINNKGEKTPADKW
jgi:type IV pilus assembly protein PilE